MTDGDLLRWSSQITNTGKYEPPFEGWCPKEDGLRTSWMFPQRLQSFGHELADGVHRIPVDYRHGSTGGPLERGSMTRSWKIGRSDVKRLPRDRRSMTTRWSARCGREAQSVPIGRDDARAISLPPSTSSRIPADPPLLFLTLSLSLSVSPSTMDLRACIQGVA